MKRYLLLLLLLFAVLGTNAQNSKRVRDLKAKKERVQKDLKKSKVDLSKTRKEVEAGRKLVARLGTEIDSMQRDITRTSAELDILNAKVDSVKEELRVLDSVLTVKKKRYVRSLRVAQAYRKVNNTMLFALAADNITQMYRRLRSTHEFAAYQRAKGVEVQQQQVKVTEYQNLLLQLKSEVNGKMQRLMGERSRLDTKKAEEERAVNNLEKKEALLKTQVKKQTQEVNALQKEIDRQVAYEIEQARKRAEAEARRKAEAERKRIEAENKKRKAQGKKPLPVKPTTPSSPSSTGNWKTPEDKKLSGGFEKNRGKLPVPITGKYQICSRYGANTSGKKNVMLLSKGVGYRGQNGAKARAIFDGEVSAVFTLGGKKNVLVRHGSYISVYCNLSSVSVRKGQKVKTRDTLGTVAGNATDGYVLQFQLRKETSLLNPEAWLGR